LSWIEVNPGLGAKIEAKIWLIGGSIKTLRASGVGGSVEILRYRSG